MVKYHIPLNLLKNLRKTDEFLLIFIYRQVQKIKVMLIVEAAVISQQRRRN